MPSNDGSPEQRPDVEIRTRVGNYLLTAEEADLIADGEPYCFRCGKPASSFSAYDDEDGIYTRVEMVHIEEGTWNPATNRFACDGCYIAIGMPAGPNGWRAP